MVMGKENRSMFTCPICLAEKVIIPAPPSGGNCRHPAAPNNNNAVDEDGNAIFELSVCNHKFCAECLQAYIRSKLLDGMIRIPCCHFRLSPLEEDFHPCGVIIPESDLRRLIFLKGRRDGKAGSDGSVLLGDACSADQSETICGSAVGGNNMICADENQLWTKYQKLKFDAYHGKDCVRRCHKCDTARLFDEGCMKEFQAKYLIEHDDQTRNVDGRNSATNVASMNPIQRAFSVFRRGEPNVGMITPPHAKDAPVSNQNDTSLEEGNTPKGDDGTSSSDNQQLLLSDTAKEKECKSVELGSSNSTAKSKPLEVSDDSPASLLSREKSKTPLVFCRNCNEEFCYFHSNAHAGKSCIEYHQKHYESDKTNIEFANKILRAKPCPNCGIAVSKDGGCNQIKCSSCGTHFCWLCREIVDDGAFPEHFRWWNLRGCANMQLDESDEPFQCTIWGAKLLSVVQIIILGIPSLLLTVLTFVLCPCLAPGCGRTNRERLINSISFWGSFLSSLFLLPFTCFGMLLMTLLATVALIAKLFIKLLTPSAGRQSTTSDNTSTVAEVGTGGSSDAADATNAQDSAPSNDFLRELETIFDRIEEGRSNSNSP